MTAITAANIPFTEINTLEKLVVWAGTALYEINKTATAIEGTGAASRVAQFGIFNVETENTNRIILRQSLEATANYAIDRTPIWLNVVELSTTALPASFLPSL